MEPCDPGDLLHFLSGIRMLMEQWCGILSGFSMWYTTESPLELSGKLTDVQYHTDSGIRYVDAKRVVEKRAAVKMKL